MIACFIEKDKRHMIKHISQTELCLLKDTCLLALKVFQYIVFTSTVGQTRLSNIAITYIEISYANQILQISMDRIIDVSAKRKNCESFMRSVHVSIIWLYIGL